MTLGTAGYGTVSSLKLKYWEVSHREQCQHHNHNHCHHQKDKDDNNSSSKVTPGSTPINSSFSLSVSLFFCTLAYTFHIEVTGRNTDEIMKEIWLLNLEKCNCQSLAFASCVGQLALQWVGAGV